MIKSKRLECDRYRLYIRKFGKDTFKVENNVFLYPVSVLCNTSEQMPSEYD